MGFKKIKTQIAVIGAGIAGCAIARELCKYKLETAVIEKEADVSWGTTKANSGHIHPGYAGPAGTLRLSTCRKGQLLFLKNSEELSIPVKWIGSLLHIFRTEELNELNHLLKQGKDNGVPGLEIITDRKRIKKLEPNISENVIASLYCREHYICSPYEAAIAIFENAKSNGATFIFDAKVTGIEYDRTQKTFLISAVDYFGSKKSIESEYIVNAAGVFADDVAKLAGDHSFSIKAIKGQYYLLDPDVKNLVNYLNVRVADKTNARSKGMYVGRTYHGNAIFGSNYEVTDKNDLATSKKSLDEIKEKLSDMVDRIPYDKVITTFAGLRAYADTGDFVLGPSPVNRKFINAAGIQSPGLTCAFLIAELAVQALKDEGLKLRPDPAYIPERKKPEELNKQDYSKNNSLYKKDSCFGQVVCRCEKVTEAEIVEAIRNGATTVDGVKFRTRAGMGRCQGGYCMLRVVKILARELKLPEENVTKSGGDSYITKYKMD